MKLYNWIDHYKYNRVCRITVGVGLVSVAIIIIMKFTEWRPVPDFLSINKDDQMNEVIEGLALSLLGACIFFMINEVYPKKKKWEVSRNYVKLKLQQMHTRIQWMVNMFRPFYFGATRRKYTESDFISMFIEEDLYEGQARSFKERIEDEKDYIVAVCEKLMGSYIDYMTNAEIKYVTEVMHSYFVCNPLVPIDKSIPEEDRIHYRDNQELIGRSIFSLYNTDLPESAR